MIFLFNFAKKRYSQDSYFSVCWWWWPRVDWQCWGESPGGTLSSVQTSGSSEHPCWWMGSMFSLLPQSDLPGLLYLINDGCLLKEIIKKFPHLQPRPSELVRMLRLQFPSPCWVSPVGTLGWFCMAEDKSKDGNETGALVVVLVTTQPDPGENYCCSQLTSGLHSWKDSVLPLTAFPWLSASWCL